MSLLFGRGELHFLVLQRLYYLHMTSRDRKATRER